MLEGGYQWLGGGMPLNIFQRQVAKGLQIKEENKQQQKQQGQQQKQQKHHQQQNQQQQQCQCWWCCKWQERESVQWGFAAVTSGQRIGT